MRAAAVLLPTSPPFHQRPAPPARYRCNDVRRGMACLRRNRQVANRNWVDWPRRVRLYRMSPGASALGHDQSSIYVGVNGMLHDIG
jgi:hypothetical protein